MLTGRNNNVKIKKRDQIDSHWRPFYSIQYLTGLIRAEKVVSGVVLIRGIRKSNINFLFLFFLGHFIFTVKYSE